MNILILMHRYPKNQDSILEKDIAKGLSLKGHKVKVVTLLERREKKSTYIYNDDGIEVLYVKVGNRTNNIGRLEKIITLLTIPFFLKKAIKKYLKNEKFDVIFGYTPAMSNAKLFRFLKQYFKSKTILFLWDIFPQNAKDLKIIKNQSIFLFLKQKEKLMYKQFDKIICNCDGSKEYLIRNNYKTFEDIEIVRNSEFLEKDNLIETKNELKIKKGFQSSDIIIIFGGNMGIPQQLGNITLLAKESMDRKNLKFLFIGNGTEKIKLMKETKELSNVIYLNNLRREEYEEYLNLSDIGIISLNSFYTVPNFPAKVTGYVKKGIPIFASLDSCSYKYLGKFIKENNLGVIAKADDRRDLIENFNRIINNRNTFSKEHFLKVYKENFEVLNSCSILEEVMRN